MNAVGAAAVGERGLLHREVGQIDVHDGDLDVLGLVLQAEAADGQGLKNGLSTTSTSLAPANPDRRCVVPVSTIQTPSSSRLIDMCRSPAARAVCSDSRG